VCERDLDIERKREGERNFLPHKIVGAKMDRIKRA
jgi:hypothetical protein